MLNRTLDGSYKFGPAKDATVTPWAGPQMSLANGAWRQVDTVSRIIHVHVSCIFCLYSHSSRMNRPSLFVATAEDPSSNSSSSKSSE